MSFIEAHDRQAMTTQHFRFGYGPRRAVALHGWFSDWTVFEPILSAIDESRYSIAFLDYRGYGASRPSPGPFDLETVAKDALAVTQALGWDSFSVIGHSMGGKAALRLALDAPRQVERILALTPVWAGAAPFDATTLDFFRGAVDSIQRRAEIIGVSTGGILPPAWARSVAERSWQVSSPEAFAGYFESWANSDFASEAAAIQQPTLVVGGANDHGIPPASLEGTWLAHLPNATLKIMNDCGHYPMLERPPALAALLTGFLDSK